MIPPESTPTPDGSAAENAPAKTVDVRRRTSPAGLLTIGNIPLLPSADHLVLVCLAVLVGLAAGLAATLLRVSVRLVSAAFFAPRRSLALLIDPDSPERLHFIEMTGRLELDVLVLGAVSALLCTMHGTYRDRHRRLEPHLRFVGARSRSYLVGLVLLLSALLHFLLRAVLAATDSVMPGHHGLFAFEHTPFWALGLVALVGGTVVGFWSHRYLPREFGGVPEVMEAVAVRGGVIPPGRAPSFGLAAGLTVASMGSVGLEGPVVVFGAGSASAIGQQLQLTRERLRVLVAAGAAAGIAAAFNAPIAGALFALEVVIGEFGITMFSPVVIASVVGTVVHQSIEGSRPLLAGVHFELSSLYEILAYVPFGILCGAVGTLFVRTLETGRAGFARVFGRVPRQLWPAIGLSALVIFAVGIGRYEVLGSGYDTVDALLDARVIGTAAIFIGAAKLVATTLTLSSGGHGGILLPSLFLGASTGSAYGTLLEGISGGRVAGPGAYALVGMGGVLTAVQHAPMTAVVMIFELCNDYSVILPLIVTCILSTLASARGLGLSHYQRDLAGRGVVLSRGKEQNVLRSLRVGDAMEHDVITIPNDTHLGDLEEIVASTTQTTYPLVDRSGRLAGVLSLSDLRHVMFEHKDIEDLVVAGELGHKTVHVIRPRDHLGDALDELATEQFENLVVVDDADDTKVVGLLSHQAVMDAYRKALLRAGVFERTSIA